MELLNDWVRLKAAMPLPLLNRSDINPSVLRARRGSRTRTR